MAFSQTKPVPAPSPTPSVLPAQKDLKDIKAKVEFIDGERIIEWSPSEVQMKLDESSAPPSFKVELTGKVRGSKNSYVVEKPSQPLKVGSGDQTTGNFTLQNEKTDFSVLEISDAGKLSTGKFRISISDWPAAEIILKGQAQIKPWSFVTGLGVSTINYTQTNVDFSSLNSLTATLKVNIDRKIGSNGIVAGFSGFFNLLQFSGTAVGANAFKFFGLNLKIGKMLKTLKEPWELGIHVGYYYLTMITNGTLGFNNVSGPELYPTISRKFNNGSQALVYFKFCPVSQQFTLLSLSNHEIAVGAQYRFAKKTKIQWLS